MLKMTKALMENSYTQKRYNVSHGFTNSTDQVNNCLPFKIILFVSIFY